jgi:hypothetical protein
MKYKLSKKFFNGKLQINISVNEIHPTLKEDKVIREILDNEQIFLNGALRREVIDAIELNNRIQNLALRKEVIDTQIELNKFMQSGALESIFYFNNKEFNSAMSQFLSSFNPMLGIANGLKSINVMIQPLLKSGNFFNVFKDIIEELPEYKIRKVTKTLQIINQAEKYQWFLDIDIINEFLEMNSTDILPKFNEEFTINYIERNFDTYILKIKNCESFKKHKDIFDESILNYKDGRIKTAIMPLFAMFDNVFTLWCKKGLDHNSNKEYVSGLWKKMNTFQNDHDKILTSRIVYLRILIIIKAYNNLFDTNHSKSAPLNRNAILHGSYDYQLIDKISFLKLIVILKELTYLEVVSYKEIEKESLSS